MPLSRHQRAAAIREDRWPLSSLAAIVAIVILAVVTPASAGPDVQVSVPGFLEGATVSGTIQWEALTQGTVERVEFSTDNGPVRWIERDAPYRWLSHGAFDTKTMPDGLHHFTVVAYSATGEARKDVTLRVANAAAPPAPPAETLAVSTPSLASGATVAGTIQWEATTRGAVERVEFSTDNGPVRWVERDAPYTWAGNGAFDTKSMPDGSHVFTVVAYSGTGQARHDVTLNVANTATAPAPTTAYPSDGRFAITTVNPIADSTLTGVVRWEAETHSRAKQVEFRIDGVLKYTSYQAPYVYLPGTDLDTRTLTDGRHTLAVTALGPGSSSKHSIPVTVRNASAAAPTRQTAPTLSGEPVVGRMLSLSTGTWLSPTPPTYTYAWERCAATCTPIIGANAQQRVVDTQDVGSRLRGVVRASNAYGTTVAYTDQTAIVGATAPPAGNLGSALPGRMPQSSGAGGTWFVDANGGSDSNPGTSSAPWRTITKALASVPLSGSIIRVRPGTYASSGTSYAIKFQRAGNASDPVTVVAETPGTVTVTNGNQSAWTLGAWIYNASGLRLQGLTFRVTTSAGANVGADAVLVENSDRIELLACTFNEMATSGVLVRGGRSSGQSADDVWLLNNTFRPSGGNAFAQTTGTGWTSDQYYGTKGSHHVYAGQTGDASLQSTASGTTRFVAANNLFVGSTAGRSIELGPQARSSYVVNNTFYGNHIGDLVGWSTNAKLAGTGVEFFANVGGASYATSNNTVKNNLFVDMNGHGSYGSGPSLSGNVVANNMAYDLDNGRGFQGDTNDDFEETYGSSLLFAEGPGNIRLNPLFVAPGGYDLRLQAGSPAIGRSDPAYTPAIDRDGRSRDGAPDLGALER